MASDKRFIRSHRLRDREPSRDLKIERGETPARTNRTRPSRSHRQKTPNRFGIVCYRMATSLAVILGMSFLMPITYAKAPTVVASISDGVAGNLKNVLPIRLKDPDAVSKDSLGLKCPQYRTTILGVGFKPKDLKTVDAIIYKESRCQSGVINSTLNRDRSHDYGLTQINGRSWCLPTRYYPDGYLQSLGIVKDCDDLLNPVTNLEAAYEIYRYAKGFSAWRQ